MQDWKIFSLGDVCKFIDYRGKTPPKTKFGVPLVTAKIIKNGIIQEPNEFIAENFYDEWMRRGIPQKGDILFTTEAPLGEVAQIKTDEKLAFAQRVIIFQVDDNILNSSYLFYALQERKLKSRIEARQSGTTVAGIKASELKKVQIDLPPLEIQKKIAAMLSSLDDKIELNNAINKNLEQQAQAIFKNYFVENFNSDWKEIYLSEIAEFIGGYSYKGNELKTSDTAMVTIKNFNRNGGFKIEGLKEIQTSARLKIEHNINLFDVVVAHTDLTQNAEIIGNAENILSFGGYKKIIFSMDVVKVVPKNDKVSKFLLGEILRTKEFKNHCLGYVNGTTVLHLSKKALPEYKLFFPSDFSVLNEVDKVVSAVYEKISTNIEENLRLAEMRDLLLPRLLNGEIDVSKVEG